MERDKILEFLRAIDAELTQQAEEGDTLNLYLIGRAALVLRYGMNLATNDIDIVHFHGSKLETKAVELFGKGTPNAERWGFYLEQVPQGLPPSLAPIASTPEAIPGEWRVLRPMQPEPHDLAVTKLKRFHTKDRQDLQILCDSGHLRAKQLEEALDSAFAFAEKEDPHWVRATANLRRVIEYLDGKTRTL